MPSKRTVPLAVAALILLLAAGTAATPPSRPTEQAGKPGKPTKQDPVLFPILPPVPTADPTIRSEKVFRVPSQLRVSGSGISVGVEAVPDALETVKITVGKDMVTGLSYAVSVYREGKLVLSRPVGLDSIPAATYSQVSATVGEVGSKDFEPGKKYKVDVRLTLFETDIPLQHFWRPESGRYKTLWSKTLTLEVEVPAAGLLVGRWRVEFANGVSEVCEIRTEGPASVVEPVRISGAKAAVHGSSVVIVFENGRIQRWTPVGKRLVVEHWFPGSQFPTGAPGVLGIAERIQR